ncbi:MAG: hypothetical protein HUU50_00180 [Candidatus Brocadiae bacterium]|nr:hypothetical protein [Candidatus Brocadiia bacterium]
MKDKKEFRLGVIGITGMGKTVQFSVIKYWGAAYPQMATMGEYNGIRLVDRLHISKEAGQEDKAKKSEQKEEVKEKKSDDKADSPSTSLAIVSTTKNSLATREEKIQENNLAALLEQIEYLKRAFATLNGEKPQFISGTEFTTDLRFELHCIDENGNCDSNSIITKDFKGAWANLDGLQGEKKLQAISEIFNFFATSDVVLYLLDPFSIPGLIPHYPCKTDALNAFHSILQAIKDSNAPLEKINFGLNITKADEIPGFNRHVEAVYKKYGKKRWPPHALQEAYQIFRGKDIFLGLPYPVLVARTIAPYFDPKNAYYNPEWGKSVEMIMNQMEEIVLKLRKITMNLDVFFTSAVGAVEKVVETDPMTGKETLVNIPKKPLQPRGIHAMFYQVARWLDEKKLVSGYRSKMIKASQFAAMVLFFFTIVAGIVLYPLYETHQEVEKISFTSQKNDYSLLAKMKPPFYYHYLWPDIALQMEKLSTVAGLQERIQGLRNFLGLIILEASGQKEATEASKILKSLHDLEKSEKFSPSEFFALWKGFLKTILVCMESNLIRYIEQHLKIDDLKKGSQFAEAWEFYQKQVIKYLEKEIFDTSKNDVLEVYLKKGVDLLSSQPEQKDAISYFLTAVETLQNIYGIKYRSLLFNVGDFKEKGSLLVASLKKPDDSLCLWIKGKLPAEIQQKLTNNEEIEEEALVKAMNEIIRAGNIYEEKKFANIQLSVESKRLLLKQNHSQNQLIQCNRLLLEDVYSKEITKSQTYNEICYPHFVKLESAFYKSEGSVLKSDLGLLFSKNEEYAKRLQAFWNIEKVRLSQYGLSLEKQDILKQYSSEQKSTIRSEWFGDWKEALRNHLRSQFNTDLVHWKPTYASLIAIKNSMPGSKDIENLLQDLFEEEGKRFLIIYIQDHLKIDDLKKGSSFDQVWNFYQKQVVTSLEREKVDTPKNTLLEKYLKKGVSLLSSHPEQKEAVSYFLASAEALQGLYGEKYKEIYSPFATIETAFYETEGVSLTKDIASAFSKTDEYMKRLQRFWDLEKVRLIEYGLSLEKKDKIKSDSQEDKIVIRNNWFKSWAIALRNQMKLQLGSGLTQWKQTFAVFLSIKKGMQDTHAFEKLLQNLFEEEGKKLLLSYLQSHLKIEDLKKGSLFDQVWEFYQKQIVKSLEKENVDSPKNVLLEEYLKQGVSLLSTHPEQKEAVAYFLASAEALQSVYGEKYSEICYAPFAEIESKFYEIEGNALSKDIALVFSKNEEYTKRLEIFWDLEKVALMEYGLSLEKKGKIKDYSQKSKNTIRDSWFQNWATGLNWHIRLELATDLVGWNQRLDSLLSIKMWLQEAKQDTQGLENLLKNLWQEEWKKLASELPKKSALQRFKEMQELRKKIQLIILNKEIYEKELLCYEILAKDIYEKLDSLNNRNAMLINFSFECEKNFDFKGLGPDLAITQDSSERRKITLDTSIDGDLGKLEKNIIAGNMTYLENIEKEYLDFQNIIQEMPRLESKDIDSEVKAQIAFYKKSQEFYKSCIQNFRNSGILDKIKTWTNNNQLNPEDRKRILQEMQAMSKDVERFGYLKPLINHIFMLLETGEQKMLVESTFKAIESNWTSFRQEKAPLDRKITELDSLFSKTMQMALALWPKTEQGNQELNSYGKEISAKGIALCRQKYQENWSKMVSSYFLDYTMSSTNPILGFAENNSKESFESFKKHSKKAWTSYLEMLGTKTPPSMAAFPENALKKAWMPSLDTPRKNILDMCQFYLNLSLQDIEAERTFEKLDSLVSSISSKTFSLGNIHIHQRMNEIVLYFYMQFEKETLYSYKANNRIAEGNRQLEKNIFPLEGEKIKKAAGIIKESLEIFLKNEQEWNEFYKEYLNQNKQFVKIEEALDKQQKDLNDDLHITEGLYTLQPVYNSTIKDVEATLASYNQERVVLSQSVYPVDEKLRSAGALDAKIVASKESIEKKLQQWQTDLSPHAVRLERMDNQGKDIEKACNNDVEHLQRIINDRLQALNPVHLQDLKDEFEGLSKRLSSKQYREKTRELLAKKGIIKQKKGEIDKILQDMRVKQNQAVVLQQDLSQFIQLCTQTKQGLLDSLAQTAAKVTEEKNRLANATREYFTIFGNGFNSIENLKSTMLQPGYETDIAPYIQNLRGEKEKLEQNQIRAESAKISKDTIGQFQNHARDIQEKLGLPHDSWKEVSQNFHSEITALTAAKESYDQECFQWSQRLQNFQKEFGQTYKIRLVVRVSHDFVVRWATEHTWKTGIWPFRRTHHETRNHQRPANIDVKVKGNKRPEEEVELEWNMSSHSAGNSIPVVLVCELPQHNESFSITNFWKLVKGSHFSIPKQATYNFTVSSSIR